jgi:predicted regulator of Ras-like GTPase activity (Roadblock/LC7/MglB family)
VAPTRPPPAPLPAAPPFRPAPAASVPAQVVEHLRKLDGVTGAFIATADGLLVAGDVADANENVLAAFAPTVFAQLTKYADMAGFGLPESIDIHLGDGATVHVRKAGKLYLGVLVPLNKPLPIDELARLSRTLQPHAS